MDRRFSSRAKIISKKIYEKNQNYHRPSRNYNPNQYKSFFFSVQTSPERLVGANVNTCFFRIFKFEQRVKMTFAQSGWFPNLILRPNSFLVPVFVSVSTPVTMSAKYDIDCVRD